MEGIVVTWRELLVVVVLVVGVYVAEVLLLMRNAGRWGGKTDSGARERELQSLELDIDRLHQRLDVLQVEFDKLKSGQESTVRPYGEAVKLAESGMDVDQLAVNCGISRGEAELIIAVNRLSHQKS